MRRSRPTALVIDLTGWAEVPPELLGLVREARAAGRPAAVVTDGTQLGGLPALTPDTVLDPAALTASKPTREFFSVVCAAVGTSADRCLFVDDQDWNIRGARAAGLSAYRWNGPEDLPYLRATLDLPA